MSEFAWDPAVRIRERLDAGMQMGTALTYVVIGAALSVAVQAGVPIMNGEDAAPFWPSMLVGVILGPLMAYIVAMAAFVPLRLIYGARPAQPLVLSTFYAFFAIWPAILGLGAVALVFPPDHAARAVLSLVFWILGSQIAFRVIPEGYDVRVTPLASLVVLVLVVGVWFWLGGIA